MAEQPREQGKGKLTMCWNCWKLGHRQSDCSSLQGAPRGAPAVQAATVVPSPQPHAHLHNRHRPLSRSMASHTRRPHSLSQQHLQHLQLRIALGFLRLADCGSDTWTKLLFDGGAITHLAPHWFAPETLIQCLERDSWFRHWCAANGQSLKCRGTKDLFLELSDQEHAPRIHIRFAVADVRLPTIAEKRLVQRVFRINKEASEGTSISRGGVSVQSIKQSGLDILRARFVPSEFRTVGGLNIEKLSLLSAHPWTSRRWSPRHFLVRELLVRFHHLCHSCPGRQRTTHADPFAQSALLFGGKRTRRSSPTPRTFSP